MQKHLTRTLQILTTIIICYFIVLTMAKHINLQTADLGRHISNGRLIINAVTQGLDLRDYTPLFTNFYSYTEPNFAINNHHWLTGVVFAIIHNYLGFKALSVFNITCVIIANIIFFCIARFYVPINQALSLVIFSLPLTCWRLEVRPEQISFVLLGLLLLILLNYEHRRTTLKTTSILSLILMLFWVNLHIFFAFGFCVIGVFYFGRLIRNPGANLKTRIFNPYFYIGLAGLIGALCNPFGISGLLQPLTIFGNFAYDLAENQSVIFMHKRFPYAIIYYYYDFMAIVTLISIGLFLQKRRLKLNNLDIAFLLLTLILLVFGFKTTRSMPNFAFVAIPALGYFWILEGTAKHTLKLALANLVWVSLLLCFYTSIIKRGIELGLPPNSEASADFFRRNNIQGPICNNYDIGGYLIYHLFPQRKVFVDNRPEAYSSSFFNDIYEPMQADETKWQEVDKKYNFNVIYFMRHDQTEHAQPFLIRRVKDPDWAPVFVDSTTIILLKRNEINRQLIEQYELPQAMFKAVSNK